MHSEEAERSWHMVHTNQGALLLAVWYRPPCYGELDSIRSLRSEWLKLREYVVGTVVVSDMNVNHMQWLRFSSGTTPEGRELCQVCATCGIEEKVRKPTGENHLLDLVLTDMGDNVHAATAGEIADHCLITTGLRLSRPSFVPVVRTVWKYSKANWGGLRAAFADTDWLWIDDLDVGAAAERLTTVIWEKGGWVYPVRDSVRAEVDTPVAE